MTAAARQAIATTSRHALAAIASPAYIAAGVPCLLCCHQRVTRQTASAGRRRLLGTEAAPSQHTVQAPPPSSTSSSEHPSSSAAPASDVPSAPSEPPQPTIADLLAYLPRNLRIPKETDLTDSTDFALYTRRFNHILLNLDKAFTKKQISALALRHLNVSQAEGKKASKRTLVRRLVTDLWELPDPQVRLANEKKVDRGATRESRTVEEQIPLLEKELFLLLGKSDGRDLLQRMASKTGTKASVRGSHPGSLSVAGLPEEVEAFKNRWKQVQSEIRTVELDTGIPAGLRADLYKPLSMATETFVSPTAGDGAKVEVTYRGASQSPVEAVEAMLRRLAARDALNASVPRLAVFSSEETSSYAPLPHVLREAPPWYLSSLPLYGLTRVTSVAADEASDVSEGIEARTIDGSEGTVSERLKAVLGEVEDVRLRATFGHHLLIRAGPSRTIEPASFRNLVQADGSHTFVQSPPPSLLSLIQTGREFSKLRLESSNIRRLLYAPKLPTSPFDYISLERVMPGPKELAKSDEAHDADVWMARRGRQASVDVLMPHASVDIRFTGYSEEKVEEAALLEPFSAISRAAVPDTLEGLHLLEDSIIRKTVFMRGLSHVWKDYSVVMERISDKLHQGAKSVKVTVESKRSTGVAGCADMLEDFKAL